MGGGISPEVLLRISTAYPTDSKRYKWLTRKCYPPGTIVNPSSRTRPLKRPEKQDFWTKNTSVIVLMAGELPQQTGI
jgi:hypothetical protein